MEFVLLPTQPTSPVSQVPYKARQKYDGRAFMNYPQRLGKRRLVTKMGKIDNLVLIQESIRGSSAEEQESFFQTWLFFGLIFEFLNPRTPQEDEAESQGARPITSPQAAEFLSRIYADLVVVQDGTERVATSALLPFLQREWRPHQFSRDDTQRTQQYDHLTKCLNIVSWMLSMTVHDFDPAIKFSIAVLGDLLAYAVNSASRTVSGITPRSETAQIKWSTGYYSADVKSQMATAGWCPSDVRKVVDRYKSMQTLHLLSKMDRPKLDRDHSRCTDLQCTYSQISLHEYTMKHHIPGCPCDPLAASESTIIQILQAGSIPLLSINRDNSDALGGTSIEVVQCDRDTPYIAISHVWSDGLGNHEENTLYECQLLRIQDLVQAVFQSSRSTSKLDRYDMNKGRDFFWLDTLCCPISPPSAKKLSLERMRQVYEGATHVLVLDNSLQCYRTSSLPVTEQIARILTSSWSARLWTLQEGALARSLYFQFADKAVSIGELHERLAQCQLNDIRCNGLMYDMTQEIQTFQYFVHVPREQKEMGVELTVLDSCLQHRSVTVASDEALCIATLLTLPLKDIISVDDAQKRMQHVWKLIAERWHGGLPSQMIFFEEPRLTAQGWRWAPASLLRSRESLRSFQGSDTRIIRWMDRVRGYPTPKGLQVTYPGFFIQRQKFTSRQVEGDPARNSYAQDVATSEGSPLWWTYFPRLPENRVLFRDAENGTWYSMSTKWYASECRNWTAEEHRAWNEKKLFPLNNLIQNGDCAVVLKEAIWPKTVGSQGQFKTTEAIACRRVRTSATLTEGLGSAPRSNDGTTLAVETVHHVLVTALGEAEALVCSTAERLARQIAEDPWTHALQRKSDEERARTQTEGVRGTRVETAAFAGQDPGATESPVEQSDELKSAIQAVRDKMKTMMQDAYNDDPNLPQAVDLMLGPGHRESAWVLIGDCWYHHDYECTKTEEQRWYID